MWAPVLVKQDPGVYLEVSPRASQEGTEAHSWCQAALVTLAALRLFWCTHSSKTIIAVTVSGSNRSNDCVTPPSGRGDSGSEEARAREQGTPTRI